MNDSRGGKNWERKTNPLKTREKTFKQNATEKTRVKK